MLQTSARLLRLLSLFQARRYWSGAGLSEELGVTGRTLRRDVDRLRTLGYPVHSTSGAAGGYQMGSGAILPPLLLEDDEAVAVVLGLRTAAGATITGIEEASVRALLKIEQVLPSRLQRRVAALHSFIVPVTMAGAGPTVDARLLASIASACRDRQRIRFSYRGRAGAPSERAVEPHRVVHAGRRWYLAAWDVGRRDWRTFRLDRIDSRIKTSTMFVPRNPPDGDFAAYVARSVSYAPYPYRARVTLHAPVETIAKRIPSTAGVLEAIDQNSCMLHTGSNSLDILAMHLAMIGVDFEVHEPPDLIAHIRELVARLSRTVQAGIKAGEAS